MQGRGTSRAAVGAASLRPSVQILSLPGDSHGYHVPPHPPPLPLLPFAFPVGPTAESMAAQAELPSAWPRASA